MLCTYVRMIFPPDGVEVKMDGAGLYTLLSSRLQDSAPHRLPSSARLQDSGLHRLPSSSRLDPSLLKQAERITGPERCDSTSSVESRSSRASAKHGRRSKTYPRKRSAMEGEGAGSGEEEEEEGGGGTTNSLSISVDWGALPSSISISHSNTPTATSSSERGFSFPPTEEVESERRDEEDSPTLVSLPLVYSARADTEENSNSSFSEVCQGTNSLKPGSEFHRQKSSASDSGGFNPVISEGQKPTPSENESNSPKLTVTSSGVTPHKPACSDSSNNGNGRSHPQKSMTSGSLTVESSGVSSCLLKVKTQSLTVETKPVTMMANEVTPIIVWIVQCW